ncbi:MAG: protein kinase [Kofleriaceae bacterium]
MGDEKGKPSVTEPATLQVTLDTEPNVAPIGTTLVPDAGEVPISLPPVMPAEHRYEYGAEIARGGMGRVVEATDTVLGRIVALKEALALDPESVRRFHRETRITARLEHPSIVPVHDAGIADNGAPFYVMRKIGGRPLEELVAQAPELVDRLALLPHIVAAANAIAHAHERGVVHRDIKPSNILAGKLGETMVIDWGLAKAIDEPEDQRRADSIVETDDADLIKTRAGIVFGTPGFMAPEQLRGAPPDERCDVYALGATLYHLLARRPPHYAKHGADMMSAAVEGPPQPLRELVPGVSPELATIIDTALAFDRNARYRDARALADELQRFLTGQLVASHHYSNREKLLRWVHKNRALVGVTSAAVAVLIIIATFAISRIVAARDRADAQADAARAAEVVAEQQTLVAIDNLNRLTIADARTKANDEPTRAVAMVKPLAALPLRWRAARDVAAAARANGIAFALLASPHTISLELSRDGQRALAAGDDGIIRLYDLTRKEPVRELFNSHAATPARFGDAEHTVVLFHDTHVTLVDVASGAHRDLETPTPVVKLEVAGPIAYYLDPQKQLWKLDLAGGAPSKIAVDEPVDDIMPSPDGRWIALAGAQHLLMIERTAAKPPTVLTDGIVRDMAWQSDAKQFAALTDDEVLAYAVDTAPELEHRYIAGTHYAVAIANDRMYATGPTGVTVQQRDNPVPRVNGLDFTLGLRLARNDVMVAGRPTGLTVLTEDGDRTISSPARLSRIETSPRGSFVVAAADGKLLVWDLDALIPRSLAGEAITAARFVTGDQLVVAYADSPAQWIDLHTNKATSLGPIVGITQLAPAPDGHRAVVIDGTHHGRMFSPIGEPIDLGDDLDHAAFLDDQRLVLATSAGAVMLGHAELIVRKHPIVALATSPAHGGWIVAAFDDRTIWRTNLESHATTTTVVDLAPAREALAILPNGDVVFGAGSELRVWPTEGKTRAVAHLGRTIASLSLIGDGRVIAIAHDGSAQIAELEHPNDPVTLALPLANASFTADGSLVGSLATSGAVEVFDPAVGERWTLAQPHDPDAPNSVQTHHAYVQSVAIAPDGRRLLAVTTGKLLIWPLGLPQTPEATVAWIETLTNATIATAGPAGLDWFH